MILLSFFVCVNSRYKSAYNKIGRRLRNAPVVIARHSDGNDSETRIDAEISRRTLLPIGFPAKLKDCRGLPTTRHGLPYYLALLHSILLTKSSNPEFPNETRRRPGMPNHTHAYPYGARTVCVAFAPTDRALHLN